jgi:hypothetical protein
MKLTCIIDDSSIVLGSIALKISRVAAMGLSR